MIKSTNYKELQEWSYKRRRTVRTHRDANPGTVLRFTDGSRHAVMSNGARRRLPTVDELSDETLAAVLRNASASAQPPLASAGSQEQNQQKAA